MQLTVTPKPRQAAKKESGGNLVAQVPMIARQLRQLSPREIERCEWIYQAFHGLANHQVLRWQLSTVWEKLASRRLEKEVVAINM